MILFLGRRDDTPLAMAIEHAADLGCPHVVLDQAELGRNDLILETGPHGVDGRLRVAGQEIALATIESVYARPLEIATVADPRELARARMFHAAMVDWLDFSSALVVNRPSSMHSNSSKPYQAQLIAAQGFDVPDTLITNDPADVLAFRAEHARVVFKSISGIRSIVRELDADAMARLNRLATLPTQFQAYVSGTDVRVHVVGHDVFATCVVSQALDYRYAAHDGHTVELEQVELPDDVAARCVTLAGALGLHLCGIDLRRRPDGSFVCFEVNPMPAFSYYEAETGQPISRALVDLLAGRM